MCDSPISLCREALIYAAFWSDKLKLDTEEVLVVHYWWYPVRMIPPIVDNSSPGCDRRLPHEVHKRATFGHRPSDLRWRTHKIWSGGRIWDQWWDRSELHAAVPRCQPTPAENRHVAQLHPCPKRKFSSSSGHVRYPSPHDQFLDFRFQFFSQGCVKSRSRGCIVRLYQS